MEGFPRDLGQPVRVAVADRARLAIGLAVGLPALGAVGLVVIDPSDRDAVLMRIVAGLLAVLGVGFAGLAGLQISRRPLQLVLDDETVTVPALPVYRAPRTVGWREVVGLGETVIEHVGLALSFQLASGERLNLARSAIPDEVVARILARIRRAELGDPASTTAGWEALYLRDRAGAAVVARGELVGWEPDLRSYAEHRDRYPDGHVLVLDRPGPVAAIGVDEETLEVALDLVAKLGPHGHLDRRNLALFADDGIYELFSLLRRLALVPDRETWPDTVRDHFERLGRSIAESAEVSERSRDLDAVRSQLRIELDDAARPLVVSRPLGGGVHALLVIDHPNGTSPVSRQVAAAWKVPDADLFAIAIGNLRADPPPQRIDRGSFAAYAGDDRVSARLLVDVPDAAVVAVPSRDVLLVMDSVLTLMVGGPMLLEAREWWARAAKPVRPDLFVWWKGELVPIGIQPKPDGGIAFVPPGHVVAEAIASMKT